MPILVLGSMSGALSGQNTTEELILEINQATDDTTRFRLINKLVLLTNQGNSDSALLLLEEIIPEAKASGHLPSLLELYYTKGVVYFEREQYDSSLLVLEEAKKIAIEIDDQLNLIHIIDRIGNSYFFKNQKDLGIKYLKESLALAKKIKNKKAIYKEANNLGRLYTYSEKFDSAEILIKLSLDIQRQLGNSKRHQAEILVNLGLNASRSKQLEKAMGYFEQSKEIMQEIDDQQGLGLVYMNIGYVYNIFGKFPESLENLHQSVNILERTEHFQNIITGREILSEVYLAIEDYDNALVTLEGAMDVWKQNNNNKRNADFLFKSGRLKLLKKDYQVALSDLLEARDLMKAAGRFIQDNVFLNIGKCYEMLAQPDSALVYYYKTIDQTNWNIAPRSDGFAGLGRIFEQRGDLNKALASFQEAYKIAEEFNFKERELELANGLYRIYKKQKNLPEALSYLEISQSIQDSLYSEKSTKEVTRMQAEFEFEQEKQQIAFEQEKENQRQSNIRRFLGIALGVMALLFLVGFFYYRSKQKANAVLSKLNNDLVEQKSIIENQKEKLEELDTLKSRFFTNISHEFRTPLTVINGMTEQIAKDPDSWLEKGNQLIKRNANQLLDLVNQILDLSKLESGSLSIHLTRGDIISYMRYLLESFHSMAEDEGVDLHFFTDYPSRLIDFDKEKILRIVSNLITNALKFTSEGGHVYLRILNSDRLAFQVIDNGIGIPEEELPHIFDRFYQVESNSTQGGGTGIGLSLTHELIGLMGGSITVESTIGRGTTFTVSLPITQEAPLEEQIDKAALSPLLIKGRTEKSNLPALEPANTEIHLEQTRLLLVEDNPDVIVYLEGLLQDNYQLIIAQNGQQGIELALEHIPDLIVSDVMMPLKDGFELCDTLKADTRTSHIPIILLTAKADVDSKITGLKRGADAYLAKPFNQEELFVRLEKLLELRRRLQERYQNLETNQSVEDLQIQKEDAFIANARAIIEAHLADENFGIHQLCKAIGISRTQLYRKIKALTNRSTSHFIRSVRLYQAKLLLQSSDLSISEVAYQVGFKDPAYFSRTFTEEFGRSPSQFLND